MPPQIRAPSAPLDEIWQPFISAPVEKPFVVAQLGQSLDGRIATPSGQSRWINGPAALDHLHRLRANVDAVVVGVATVIADDPLLTVRRVAGAQPARVVIDPNGRIPIDAKCMAQDGGRCLIVRGNVSPVPDGAECIVVPSSPRSARAADIDPAAIIAALFARGLRKILVEGGATTVSKFIDANAVDRLHILVAPLIIGSGVTGLSLQPIAELTAARRPVSRVHILDDGDVLFDCDLRQQSKG